MEKLANDSQLVFLLVPEFLVSILQCEILERKLGVISLLFRYLKSLTQTPKGPP